MTSQAKHPPTSMAPKKSIAYFTPGQTEGFGWLGWAFAFGASLAFSFAPTAARGAIVAGMEPTTLLMARVVLGSVLLFVTNLIIRREHLVLDRYGLRMSMWIGGISGVAMLCFFQALSFLDASIISMILATMPVAVLLMLALRGTPLTGRTSCAWRWRSAASTC
ncbi:MAG: DMT family transporter [Caldilineaceae bacterium]|nr:DMT family transporter [Caldilineaceae bacterium]